MAWFETRRRGRGFVVALAVVSCTACVTTTPVDESLEAELSSGRYDRALDLVAADRRSADRLLTLLQRGHVLHYAGRFDESNAAFQQAEDLAADLYTRSVSRQAASILTNDLTIEYRAEPFELAMVPYYRAFNYLSLGDPDGAQVEARKATLTLADAVEATVRELDRPEDRAAAERLGDNGFLHWFSGLLYESDGALNDAFIAYRNAARAYLATRDLTGLAPPADLGRDLERVGLAIGFRDEVEQLRTEAPELFEGVAPRPAASGEVVLVLEGGWVARKQETMLNLPILDVDRRYGSQEAWAEAMVGRASSGWSAGPGVSVDYWLTVAMPTMGPSSTGTVVSARISAAGIRESTVPVDDLTRRAVATFEAKRGTILFRTILRALAKYAATEAAARENEVAGVLVNLFGVVTERADTRCWGTLPDRLSMARLQLPAGDHEVTIDYLDHSGVAVTSETVPVRIEAGGLAFLNRRPF